jgi:hypothetical protein
MTSTLPDLFSRVIRPIGHQWLAFFSLLALSVLIPLSFFCAGINPYIGLFTYVGVVVGFAFLGFRVHRAECDDVRAERDNLKNERDALAEKQRNMSDQSRLSKGLRFS